MKQSVIKTEILIAAPPERVWLQLTDFAAFPSWNPFILEASGPLKAGAQLEVKLDMGRHWRLTIKPTLTVVRENEELRWVASQALPGLFDVDRSFEIRPEPDRGGVRFVQSERCSGALRPLLFAGDYEARVYNGYDALNLALRARVEQAA